MVARIFLSSLAIVAAPHLALAADGVQIPEAPSGVLFALGVLGVIVGRQFSRRRRKKLGRFARLPA